MTLAVWGGSTVLSCNSFYQLEPGAGVSSMSIQLANQVKNSLVCHSQSWSKSLISVDVCISLRFPLQQWWTICVYNQISCFKNKISPQLLSYCCIVNSLMLTVSIYCVVHSWFSTNYTMEYREVQYKMIKLWIKSVQSLTIAYSGSNSEQACCTSTH